MSRIDQTRDLEVEMLDAAMGSVSFERVLTNIVGHFGADGGVVFELNRRTGEISNWIGPGLEGGAQDYIEHLNAINPRMRYSLRHAPGHIAYDGRFTSERAMDRNEFYDAIRRASGVRYFLGSRVYDSGDLSMFHSIEFSPRHGHPQADKIRTFARTSDTLGKAWRLAKSQAHALAPADGGSFLFEHLPSAIFSVGPDGTVVAANENANDLVFRHGPLSLVQGALLTASRDINDAIVHCIRRALNGQAGAVVLRDESGAVPLVMQSLPTPGRRSALLFIRDPRQSSTFGERIMPKLFGLTAAEVRVANALAQGKDLQAVAEALQISRNTARNHLQSIYRKTGTRSRGEYLSLVFGLIDN